MENFKYASSAFCGHQSIPLGPRSEYFFLFGAPHFATTLQIFYFQFWMVAPHHCPQPQANFHILAFGQTFKNPAVVWPVRLAAG
jgi:hypothetical protein